MTTGPILRDASLSISPLFEQDHPFVLSQLPGVESVQIHSAREPACIPIETMFSGFETAVNQRCYCLTEHVIDA